MNKLPAHIAIWITAFVALVMPLAPAVTSAATPAPGSGQALEIAPPVISLKANPGQVLQAKIFLRDISSVNLVVKGQANDFVAAGEDGTPKLLLKDTGANNPYSLKDWIATPGSLVLVPKEIKTMNVTIRVPANASPGGHYGVIRFTATPAGLKGTGVSLSASLGALVLVTVNGKISQDLSVEEFAVSHDGHKGSFFESAPLQFIERFKNNGNVHVQPVGRVTITDMFGKKVAAVNVNLPPGNVLPNSIRKFEQPLDKTVIGNKRLFGRYTAKLEVTYGTNKKTLTDSLTFWVIPYKLIVLGAIIVVAGFFVIRSLIRRYNQSIINRARNGRR